MFLYNSAKQRFSMEILQVLNIETFKNFMQYFTFKYTHKKKYHKKYKFEDFFFIVQNL